MFIFGNGIIKKTMKKKKKVAVLVRDRQIEALRMAVGLTLADNEVTVFIMDKILSKNEAIDMSLEALKDLKVKIFSNVADNNFGYMKTEDIAHLLTEYSIAIPY